MDLKEKALLAVDALEKEYPEAQCSLEYDPDKAYELLISTRLSAQCTDARVNIVTKDLFAKYTSLADFANAPQEEMEQMIKTCGLFKTKARDIISMSKMLIEQYGGRLPDTVEELTKLPGIGRKTANLIVGDIYHKPAVVCDTHCIRITNLLGLSHAPTRCRWKNSCARCCRWTAPTISATGWSCMAAQSVSPTVPSATSAA